MAVAEAPSVIPAEECTHPAPVSGVMAHEFAHYEGALGPEGTRRTVTYYGPVIGGLPISAWYCEQCGLLRLTYPDGRREERHMFPGPQPGLLAEPSVVATGALRFGRQARVSGLSAPGPLYDTLYSQEIGPAEMAIRLPRVQLPELDFLGWLNVTGLVALAVGLFAAAVIAVAGTSVPSSEAPLVVALGSIFAALLIINILAPAWRRVFPMPPLAPSAAETHRGPADLDAPTRGAITLLVLAAIGLLVSAILATYTYSLSAATGPVFILSLLSALGGAALLIGRALLRP